MVNGNAIFFLFVVDISDFTIDGLHIKTLLLQVTDHVMAGVEEIIGQYGDFMLKVRHSN